MLKLLRIEFAGNQIFIHMCQQRQCAQASRTSPCSAISATLYCCATNSRKKQADSLPGSCDIRLHQKRVPRPRPWQKEANSTQRQEAGDAFSVSRGQRRTCGLNSKGDVHAAGNVPREGVGVGLALVHFVCLHRHNRTLKLASYEICINHSNALVISTSEGCESQPIIRQGHRVPTYGSRYMIGVPWHFRDGPGIYRTGRAPARSGATARGRRSSQCGPTTPGWRS